MAVQIARLDAQPRGGLHDAQVPVAIRGADRAVVRALHHEPRQKHRLESGELGQERWDLGKDHAPGRLRLSHKDGEALAWVRHAAPPAAPNRMVGPLDVMTASAGRRILRWRMMGVAIRRALDRGLRWA